MREEVSLKLRFIYGFGSITGTACYMHVEVSLKMNFQILIDMRAEARKGV